MLSRTSNSGRRHSNRTRYDDQPQLLGDKYVPERDGCELCDDHGASLLMMRDGRLHNIYGARVVPSHRWLTL